MESTDSSTGSPQPNLPPGFRFHPTDEELVVHYLKKKTSSAPLPVAIIADVDLYKFDPWELPAQATFGEQEWYFFSPRDRKYPNGARPNRAATSGYWKATGTDKPVLSSDGKQKVGVKKALVFYGGKPPKGTKTNWIMHEYRIVENKVCNKPPCYDLSNKKNSLRLDDWVLCRIYKKNSNNNRVLDQDKDDSMDDMTKMNNFATWQLDHGDQSLFQAIGLMNNTNTSNIDHGSIGNFVSPHPHVLHSKRSFPALFGTDNPISAGASTSKRFQLDDSYNNNINNNSNNNDQFDDQSDGSIATLLNQMPTNSSQLHQQSVLGSSEHDGNFRMPFQIPGLNWYS